MGDGAVSNKGGACQSMMVAFALYSDFDFRHLGCTIEVGILFVGRLCKVPRGGSPYRYFFGIEDVILQIYRVLETCAYACI